MKYRMYVDEVGNSDIEGSDNPNQRYLSLTGVICELPHVEASIYPVMYNERSVESKTEKRQCQWITTCRPAGSSEQIRNTCRTAGFRTGAA